MINQTFNQLPSLSLYIHIPWCVRKCPYCDFNSHQQSGDIPETEYLHALIEDLNNDLHLVQDRPIHSIFIGGGTPSLMSANFYQLLFEALQEKLVFSNDIEITLEANPGTFEAEKFKAYRELGINRLSIGIQSFDDQLLKSLGRIHGGDEAKRAIETAQKAGFDNFNLDLMHGLPNQTSEMAVSDLEQALLFRPNHLSWYQLTIEPNTEFYSSPPPIPADEILWDIQEQGQALLAKNGLSQYEVSAYSKTNKEAKHNLNYWQFGDYLGIGAGAHGKLTSLSDQSIFRSQKTRLPKNYMERIGNKGKLNKIDTEQLPFEFMLNALRLKQGVDESIFEQQCGIPFSTIEKQLNAARSKTLMHSNRIQATEKGFLFLNDLMDMFLDD